MREEEVGTLFLFVVVIALIVGICLIFPYMEARTFNKFSTDKKATIIDALFAELRVEGCR